jgi:nicotinate-nucleotide adenylyltransferase
MRIGIFGGTFDPPHLGHIIPIEIASVQFHLDQVWFVPNYIPPHKHREDLTDPYHRAAMLAIALQRYPHFLLLTLELQKGKVNFTVDTLAEIKSALSPRDSLFFILGSELFLQVETWHDYARLLQLSEFIIINRGNSEQALIQHLQQLEKILQIDLNRIVHFAKSSHLPFSSTEIRASLTKNEDVSGMLFPEVKDYILKHKLYTRR